MGQKAEPGLGITDSQSVRLGIAFSTAPMKTTFGYILETVVSGDKVNGLPIGKRWIVERTFSWLDNYRRPAETMN